MKINIEFDDLNQLPNEQKLMFEEMIIKGADEQDRVKWTKYFKGVREAERGVATNNKAKIIRDKLDEIKSTLEKAEAREETIEEACKDLGNLLEDIKSSSTTIQQPYSFEDYERDTKNYDPDKEFSPNLFNELHFPDGTMSVIGARTARGKTTALVNLAMEALDPQPSNNNKDKGTKASRKCIFITLEMSARQLFNKLILQRVYSKGNKDLPDGITNTHGELYKIMLAKITGNRDINTNINEHFKTHSDEAMKFIKEKVQSEDLKLFEAWHLKQKEIIEIISKASKGTLVLIDYIQRMPDDLEVDRYDGFMRIKKISDALVNATIKSGAITICGAQFNRAGGYEVNGDDKFDDTAFRESGDIEQDAHNAIGIGLEGNKNDRFYKVLKARESKGVGEEFKLIFNGAYSYMEIGEKIERTSNSSNKTKRGKGKKPIGEQPKSNDGEDALD